MACKRETSEAELVVYGCHLCLCIRPPSTLRLVPPSLPSCTYKLWCAITPSPPYLVALPPTTRAPTASQQTGTQALQVGLPKQQPAMLRRCALRLLSPGGEAATLARGAGAVPSATLTPSRVWMSTVSPASETTGEDAQRRAVSITGCVGSRRYRAGTTGGVIGRHRSRHSRAQQGAWWIRSDGCPLNQSSWVISADVSIELPC